MNKTRNEIWQILDTRKMAGIESHVLELSQGLIKNKWAVSVIFINDFGIHPLKFALDQAGISWLCLDGTVLGLWKAISKHKPTVIHSHGYKAGIFSRFIGIFRNIQVVSTYHAGEKCRGKLALYNYLDQITARFSQPIAVSSEIAAKLTSKTVQIDNFVSIPPLQKRAKGKRIAFVGRLSIEKGPDVFLEIARSLPNFDFHVFGDGPMREELLDAASMNMTFHGQQKMSDYWDEIDLLCMPSRFEGLPMAVLEAMARAIPVIASDVGGLPNLIAHQKNGWVCPKNDIEKFSKAILEWHNLDELERDDLSRNAYIKIRDHHSPSVIIPKIETIYQNCEKS